MSSWGDPNRPTGPGRSTPTYGQPDPYGQSASTPSSPQQPSAPSAPSAPQQAYGAQPTAPASYGPPQTYVPQPYGQQPTHAQRPAYAPHPTYAQQPAYAQRPAYAQQPGRHQPDQQAPARPRQTSELETTTRTSGGSSRLRSWSVNAGIGVAALTIWILRGYARHHMGAVPIVGLTVVLVAAIVGVRMYARRAVGRRHAHVVAARPGAEVVEVDGIGLYEAMAAAGATHRSVTKGRTTPLTMTILPEGFELWSGTGSDIRVIAQVRWTSVQAICEMKTQANPAFSSKKPALMLISSLGRVVLMPRRHADGGRALNVAELGALAGRLIAPWNHALAQAAGGDQRRVR